MEPICSQRHQVRAGRYPTPEGDELMKVSDIMTKSDDVKRETSVNEVAN